MRTVQILFLHVKGQYFEICKVHFDEIRKKPIISRRSEGGINIDLWSFELILRPFFVKPLANWSQYVSAPFGLIRKRQRGGNRNEGEERGRGRKTIYEFQIQMFTFSDVRVFDFRICLVWKIFSKNMLVRYRGINNKGVLERPWTKWKLLMAISTTLKCQFTGKCWKVDFSMPCKTKSRDNLLRCLRTVRAVTLDTSRPPQFHLK